MDKSRAGKIPTGKGLRPHRYAAAPQKQNQPQSSGGELILMRNTWLLDPFRLRLPPLYTRGKSKGVWQRGGTERHSEPATAMHPAQEQQPEPELSWGCKPEPSNFLKIV